MASGEEPVSIIALIPARSGSKGIPGKNFRPLAGGPSCFERAVLCALAVPCDQVIVSTDAKVTTSLPCMMLERPPELAEDDTPMIDVVKHAMACVPGSSEDIWVLLQPTQPLRYPSQVQTAIQRLREIQADSVVSVVELPKAHHAHMQLEIRREALFLAAPASEGYWYLWDLPPRRQNLEPTYLRDGTVYAFWRKTVDECGSLYGRHVRPLIIPPDETCELDTPADWDALERRLASLS